MRTPFTPRRRAVKDFLIGSRAAWQDLNARGGVRGRRVNHVALEVDGAAVVHGGLASLRDDPACVALSGSAGDPVAVVAAVPRRRRPGAAGSAPDAGNTGDPAVPGRHARAGPVHPARYTAEVLAEVDGAPTRASVLAAFQRRSTLDVGGFRVAFDSRRRSSAFVTQSMLMPDGRVVG